MNLTKKIIKTLLIWLRNVLNPIFKFKEISVLCYHDISNNDWELSVSPVELERQIVFLKDLGCSFITVEQLVDFINQGIDLPNKSVLFTFDDGYKSVCEHALPVLERQNVPALVFLVGDRGAARNNLGNELPLLNEAEISELKMAGIELGYHSKTHKRLGDLSDEDADAEMNSGFEYFAYPGGSFASDSKNILKKHNYIAAFCIHNGLVHKGDNIYAINRNVIEKGHTLGDIKFFTTKAVDWFDGIN